WPRDVITTGYLIDLKRVSADRLKCWLRLMPSLFSSIFNQPCSHQFSWPERRSDGGHCQVCIKFVPAVVISMCMTGRRWLGLRKSRHLGNLEHSLPNLLHGFHVPNASRCAR